MSLCIVRMSVDLIGLRERFGNEEGALYISKWCYEKIGLNHLQNSVALCMHDRFGKLSSLWKQGEYGESDDVQLILCNAQSHAAQSRSCSVLSCCVVNMSQAFEVLKGEGYFEHWVDAVVGLGLSLYVPICDGCRYYSLFLDTKSRNAYWLDSLNMETGIGDKLKECVEQIGFIFVDMSCKWQIDGWSCGVWCTICYMLCLNYVNNSSIDESFRQWFLSRVCCSRGGANTIGGLASEFHLRIAQLFREGDDVRQVLGLIEKVCYDKTKDKHLSTCKNILGKVNHIGNNNDWKEPVKYIRNHGPKVVTSIETSNVCGVLLNEDEKLNIQDKSQAVTDSDTGNVLQTKKAGRINTYLKKGGKMDEILTFFENECVGLKWPEVKVKVTETLSYKFGLEAIRQKFYRWEPTSKKKHAGKSLGIGMSVSERLADVSITKADKDCNKLALIFLTQYTDLLERFQVKAIGSALRRYFMKSKSLGIEIYVKCDTDLPDLTKDNRFAAGVDLDKQIMLSIQLYTELKCNNSSIALPEVFRHVMKFCSCELATKGKALKWNAQHSLKLVSKLSSMSNTDVEFLIGDLKNDNDFNKFSTRLLRSKILELQQARSKQDGGAANKSSVWNVAVEERFKKAFKACKVNFSKHSIQQCSEVVTASMGNTVLIKDVLRRLIQQRYMDLRSKGLDMSCFLKQPADDSDEELEEDEVQCMSNRLDVAQAALDFNALKIEGPTTRCCSCGQLNFSSTMKILSNKRIEGLTDLPDVQHILAYLLPIGCKHEKRRICTTCDTSLSEKRAPKLCFGEHLPHNNVPDYICDLTDLEADLVSPQIAFAKIVQVQWQKQRRLKGAIVNVPADFIGTVTQLPRTDMKDFKQAVDLKRKLEYKANYKSGLVRVQDVKKACVALCKTALYKACNIEAVNTLDEYIVDSDPLNEYAVPLNTDKCDEGLVTSTEQVPACDETEILKDKEMKSKDLVKEHIDESGHLIVADDEDLYEDEDDVVAGGQPSQTMLDSENNANEFRESVMRVAPSEHHHPQGILMQTNGEEYCFPRLFGGHERSGYEGVMYSMIARHELRSADRRFARDASNIFYKMRKKHCQTVCGTAAMAVRRGKRGSVCAGQLKSPIERDEVCHHDLGYLALKTLRTSPDYKDKIKKDMFAMIQQLGKPCWFVTLTCGTWKELLHILYNVKHSEEPDGDWYEKLSSADKAQMVAEDPVTCARYYWRRAAKFIETMFLGTGMIGKVCDFAGVDEFTVMGNPHTHLILWTEDCPVFESDNDEDVIAYIDEYVKTDIDMVEEKLGNVQRHKHNRRCGGRLRPCSFGFPKPPMQETKILLPFTEIEKKDIDLKQCTEDAVTVKNFLRELNVLMKKAHVAGERCPESEMNYERFSAWHGFSEERYILALRSGIHRPTVFHQRKLKHLMVNAFNPDMLNIWQANIDIQHILNPWAATMYVASYISKSQRGLSSLMKAVSAGEFANGAELVRRAGKAWINTSEISVQEAVYHVLGLNFRRFSRETYFINTGFLDDIHMMSKRVSELAEMADDDTDVFQKTHQEKYGTRISLFDECMANYFGLYKWVREKSDEGSMIWKPRKRLRPKILRWVGNKKARDILLYCREQVMLFVPWKNEVEGLLITGVDQDGAETTTTWLQVFQDYEEVIRTNRQMYRAFTDEEWDDVLKDIQEAAERINGVMPSEEGDVFGDRVVMDHDEENPATETVKNKPSLLSRQDLSQFKNDKDFAAMIASFNRDQLLFFKYVLRKMHEVLAEPIRVFLTGGAGVGKTHVVHAITQAVTKHFNFDVNCDIDTLRVLLLAPTGKAGFNIGGTTIHNGLSIPPSNASTQFRKLSASQLAECQSKYRHLKLLIVDEVSMLGSQMFTKLEDRLREIMNCAAPFGGVHVILVGDLYQLQPVAESWIFRSHAASVAGNLWKDHFKMFELTEIMRQKDDKTFAELLNRLRVGKCTVADRQLLATRQLPKNMKVSYLYPENQSKDHHNKLVLDSRQGCEVQFQAVDILPADLRTEKAQASARDEIADMPTNRTAGLPTLLRLKPDLPVEVTTNVDVNDGICNGADGRYKHNAADLIWIQFYSKKVGAIKRSEPSIKNLHRQFELDTSWTPIERTSKEITKVGKKAFAKKVLVTRKQYPVVLAAARTIHHSQGSTYQEGGVDMGNSFTNNNKKPYIRPGHHYVALARFTSLENVWLTDFDVFQALVCKDAAGEMKRMSEESSLEVCIPEMTSKKGKLSMYVQNVRSFEKHSHYITKSCPFMKADLMFLSETCCAMSNKEECEGLTCIEMCGKKSRPRGIAFLARQGIELTEINRLDYDAEVGVELICVKVLQKDKTFTIAGLYRSPGMSVPRFLSTLRSFICSCHSDPDVVVGDFNINLDDGDNADCASLTQVMQILGYTNIKTDFTRCAGVMQSRLDHVWTRSPESTQVEVGYDWFSDHMPMFCYLQRTKVNKYHAAVVDMSTANEMGGDMEQAERTLRSTSARQGMLKLIVSLHTMTRCNTNHVHGRNQVA